MAVIDTNQQWVSMEKVWLFNVTPLFNVAVWCMYVGIADNGLWADLYL